MVRTPRRVCPCRGRRRHRQQPREVNRVDVAASLSPSASQRLIRLLAEATAMVVVVVVIALLAMQREGKDNGEGVG